MSRPILVTKPQGRYLEYLDRCGYASEYTAAKALYGSQKRGGSAITKMARNLSTLGLIERRAIESGRVNLWNQSWQRTSKPYEVKS